MQISNVRLLFRAPSPATVRLLLDILLVLLVLSLLIGSAYAGTDGAVEFQGIYDKLKGWVGGYLGKLIALFAFMVGLFYGAVKQNFIVALGGVGIAIMVAVMPSLMEGLVGGVI